MKIVLKIRKLCIGARYRVNCDAMGTPAAAAATAAAAAAAAAVPGHISNARTKAAGKASSRGAPAPGTGIFRRGIMFH